MFNKKTGLGVALVGLTLAASTVAFAEGHSAKTPEQRAQHAAARFQKADKNNDGALTQDEVSAKRWERIKVADTNSDGKITKAELDQAHKDGKITMGHRHGRKAPQQKS